ncbi:ABC transporter ATP-binding protein [Nocardioides eburneiflavus]|uniref:ABC transporter ATP-binding protein n=1 Tax=Nocardioides eburneiflavus TaxID=2518372 RepID=A0A4Z1CI62_9ACTN|nr:ABC transporter ATP-binding protein [Nocardioides eburneiflavus]TGN66048.1 ABC transporter ATP-binding protein [Nocardioides eburneiflavus]
MSRIRVTNLTKRFGSSTIVDDLELTIEEGEFVVLLGPSGCGKTTTLRCLAGLETPEGGTISFADKVVHDAERRVSVPTHKRNIGMIFQSYALWPHMTVRDNIAYPLKVRRQKDALRTGAVEKAAGMVDCEQLLDRYPSQLSGGQQQRVAVARGLVSEPDLVLFDEPLSNLDARLRDQVRTQIHQLHQRLGFSAVFVTHDQSEAFALGDRLAIMKSGRLEQVDTPQQVFDEPSSDYVAQFIGMANRLDLTRHQDGWKASNGDVVHLGDRTPERGSTDTVVARLRRDDLRLHRPDDRVAPGTTVLHGTLVTTEFGGRHHDVLVDVDGQKLTLQADTREHGGWLPKAEGGHPVVVSFRSSDVRVFDAEGRAVRGASVVTPIRATGSATS